MKTKDLITKLESLKVEDPEDHKMYITLVSSILFTLSSFSPSPFPLCFTPFTSLPSLPSRRLPPFASLPSLPSPRFPPLTSLLASLSFSISLFFEIRKDKQADSHQEGLLLTTSCSLSLFFLYIFFIK